MQCDFCLTNHKIFQNSNAFALYDKYPVTIGHILIISNRHVANWFELSFKEQIDCMILVNEMKEYLQKEYNPDGFNIGINIGTAAGQTINHVHVHLIPRYKDDCEDPTGGVRGVIPEKQKY